MSEVLNVVPVIPLRDVVIYPSMTLPLNVGRKKSIEAVKQASNSYNNYILLATQKNGSSSGDVVDNIYDIGTLAKVVQIMKLPDGSLKIIVEGIAKRLVAKYESIDGCIYANLDSLHIDDNYDPSQIDKELKAILLSITDSLKKFVDISGKVSKESLATLINTEEPHKFIYEISTILNTEIAKKQKILEATDIKNKALLLLSCLYEELEILELEAKIKDRVKSQVDKNQREYYLNEQVKAIYKELGEADEESEVTALKSRIEATKMSKEAKEKCLKELKKLKAMPPSSSESAVSRNYIETILSLPWGKKAKVKKDINLAEKVLEKDHYGIKKVKERILEHLAVQIKRDTNAKAPILCLVGPPGVGKTSIGQSIARATGREYVRMALGGVRDESEIRGHRRTYIGSMPGQIIQKIIKSKTENPLFLLDEIDKISSDFRGDPSAALLEVLDPEQNSTFNDHYLEIDYDLSKVMFVATANSLDIDPALRDRLEIIHLSGYTEIEKQAIAKQYLVPKALENNGLTKNEINFTPKATLDIIRYYTREAGVRNLQQKIDGVCRKAVKNLLKDPEHGKVSITQNNLEDYLGVHQFDYGIKNAKPKVGQVTGLAWTSVGGELLTIEALAMPGKGKVKYTGSLGDVMKESIDAAFSVVRSISKDYRLEDDFYEKKDIHIHVPEGATPKDGPSAGIAMTTALVSVYTNKPVRNDIAMTGEVTLRGDVLAIGGLKEKLLAALRGGIKEVLIPKQNVKNLADVDKEILEKLEITPVNSIKEVLERVF
ncbi:endopeptidase La [Francisella philomiragia subsp. philomiragia ATCC 25015]|uniref:endopeptidase La n=1 Tax=Francisella philomiragia TaxID=28110 RepID=UPI0001AF7AC9|nr:endopeptidase La [Francisella philomiragia]AJI74699.1 endopeptidase La [Francisella philomiragia subsp. philomiragia ATCC 25015]EET21293.1 DNA-binding, ATP-dependent protease La [Francisella philomiragia subsp. philomiragia ATCC 25015]MBK2237725.1 endopeptidase La [Francisella philomiragia]